MGQAAHHHQNLTYEEQIQKWKIKVSNRYAFGDQMDIATNLTPY